MRADLSEIARARGRRPRASRCRSTPIGRSCAPLPAPRRSIARPSAIGRTTPGKQHEVAHRDDGKDVLGEARAPRCCGDDASAAWVGPGRAGVVPASARWDLVLDGHWCHLLTELAQAERQAAVDQRRAGPRRNGPEAARCGARTGRRGVSRRWMRVPCAYGPGIGRSPGHDQDAVLDQHLELLLRHARQGDGRSSSSVLGLQEVDRRLPRRLPPRRCPAARRTAGAERSARPEQFAGFGPHPGAGDHVIAWLALRIEEASSTAE